jgi:hypothetical protein
MRIHRLNEFYKKGCQEKTSALTGGREDLGLDIQPTVYVSAPIAQGFARNGLSFPWFFAGGDHANRV